jgi:hypothetical protein
MTTSQAHARLLAEAERHRKEGRWDIGHEWQRRANDLARLASMAEGLPRAKEARR